MRISIILTILANGEKLPPLIVFKGKPGKTLENNLNSNNQNCISKKIFIKCQENAWVTKDIFKFWFFKIWFPYANKERKNQKLLIMDRATSHFYDEIKEDFESRDLKYVLIPPGLTRFL